MRLRLFVSVVKSSVFLRQRNAFFRSGSLWLRYGSHCPVGSHFKTALADDIHRLRGCPFRFLFLFSGMEGFPDSGNVLEKADKPRFHNPVIKEQEQEPYVAGDRYGQ